MSQGLVFQVTDYLKKTIDSIGALQRIIKTKDKNNESKPDTEKKSRRFRFDEFEKNVIKITVYSCFLNETKR